MTTFMITKDVDHMTDTRLLAVLEPGVADRRQTEGASGDLPAITTEPIRFQRKPEYVEAVQLTQEAVDAHVLDDAPLPVGCRLTSARCHRGNRTVDFAAVRLITPKHELVMPGDWVVRSADGKFRVYRPDEFEATYEAVKP